PRRAHPRRANEPRAARHRDRAGRAGAHDDDAPCAGGESVHSRAVDVLARGNDGADGGALSSRTLRPDGDRRGEAADVRNGRSTRIRREAGRGGRVGAEEKSEVRSVTSLNAASDLRAKGEFLIAE